MGLVSGNLEALMFFSATVCRLPPLRFDVPSGVNVRAGSDGSFFSLSSDAFSKLSDVVGAAGLGGGFTEASNFGGRCPGSGNVLFVIDALHEN